VGAGLFTDDRVAGMLLVDATEKSTLLRLAS
jgi:hypothetical protein